MKNLIYFLIAVLLIGVIFGFTLDDDKNAIIDKEMLSLTITEPGNYDVSKYDEIIVDIKPSTEINLQDKTVTPDETIQTITPDLNYNGLGSVTINPIPDSYVIPDGTLEITKNGIYDVSNKSEVNINIESSSSGVDSNGILYIHTKQSDHSLSYSTDYGKTWIDSDFFVDVFDESQYCVNIDLKNGVIFNTSNSDNTYGIVLIRFDCIPTSTSLTKGFMTSVDGISYNYAVFIPSNGDDTHMSVTLNSNTGGAD